MLEVDNIDTFYGKSHVLHDVSLSVAAGEVVGLLGRNGAGKTTTLRSIMGLTPPRNGSITFKGEDITSAKPEDRYKRGIGFVPEERHIFPGLSVHDNLLVGLNRGQSPDEAFEPVFEYFPRLEDRVHQRAGTLSGGEQQMLAIGRTLVSNPDLLLIDEPSEGLMPDLVEQISEIIRKLNVEGHTIVLVEQDVQTTLDLSDRAYIISNGRIEHGDTATAIRENFDDFSQYLTV